MNILSQNIKFMLKNNLKEVFSSFSSQLLNTIVDSFSTNTHTNYIKLISNIEEETRNLIINIIISTLETYDNEFKYSNNRKKLYEINKSDVPRTITTIFGNITYKRTYYKSKLNNSYHFLLDEELGLIPASS